MPLEQPENRRAAARHRGVNGPFGQQTLFGVTDGRMRGKDMLFEIVGHQPLPLGDGPPETLRERHLRNPRPHPGIGLAGRNPLSGLDNGEPPPSPAPNGTRFTSRIATPSTP